MSEVETKPKFVMWLLVAVLAFNVLGIGLSEVQHRHLGELAYLATLELREVAQQRLAQQAKDLYALYKSIDVVDARR